MGTVLIGAALGAAMGGAAATAGIITSTAILGSALATGMVGGALLGGGMGAIQELGAPDSGSISVPKADQIADKSLPQQAAQLDAPDTAEAESEKRKRKSAKQKFKIEKESDVDQPTEAGVTIGGETDTTKKISGVQI